MDNNNSENSVQFGFNKPNTNKVEQKIDNVIPPVEEQQAEKPASKSNTEEDDINEEYTDKRTITVNLVKSISLYRKANDKVLPKRRDYIGSSVSSSRILSSSKEDIETYFPNLVGYAPNNPEFLPRVKQYLNNIRIPVDELGRTFDISFHYNHKKDYYKIKKQEEKIEDAYNKVNRQNIGELRKALSEKIKNLNILETSKCKLGYPLYVEDYLMYRHCLLYNDVAKDIAFINVDRNVRFYFKDDQREEERLRKYRIEINKAKANYVSILSDDSLFDAVYVQYCVINNLPVLASLAEDRLTREIKLDKFSTDEPVKFNKIYHNKDIKLIGTIENLIARGELIRSQYNQNITTVDGVLIGANMGEAVAWFKNPANNSEVNAYYNALKNI